mgnify:FL=1
MNMKDKIILQICNALTKNEINVAKKIVEMGYPHQPLIPAGRSYTKKQSIKIFIRDGFIDRYSGKKLIFPPVLKVISNMMPDLFPYQKNWKMTECHIAYWQLFPTIDHIIPIARGGEDNDTNYVSTSMLRNSAKSNWLLEELGWDLYPPGSFEEWDGLVHWFLEYAKSHPDILKDQYIYKWHKAVMGIIKL